MTVEKEKDQRRKVRERRIVVPYNAPLSHSLTRRNGLQPLPLPTAYSVLSFFFVKRIPYSYEEEVLSNLRFTSLMDFWVFLLSAIHSFIPRSSLFVFFNVSLLFCFLIFYFVLAAVNFRTRQFH